MCHQYVHIPASKHGVNIEAFIHIILILVILMISITIKILNLSDKAIFKHFIKKTLGPTSDACEHHRWEAQPERKRRCTKTISFTKTM